MEKIEYFEDYAVGLQRNTSGRLSWRLRRCACGPLRRLFPHHVDAEFARKTPFGERIAHGTMTFTIGIGLTASQINPVAFTYGYDRLRFPKAVLIGDTIYTRVTIKGKEEDAKRPGFGLVVEACEMINQRGDVVVYREHILIVQMKSEVSKG